MLGFFQVMGGQNDGGTRIVDLAQEVPHGVTKLNVNTGRWFIEDQ